MSSPVYRDVTLDRSLSYKQHCEKISKKVGTRNNIIRMLAGSTWGASADTLRRSSLALVYSAAEYAASTLGSSQHAKIIDNALNTTMRTITGTLKSTPLHWLPVMANIAPPDLRRRAPADTLIRRIEARSRGTYEIPLMSDINDHPTCRLSSRSPIWTRL